MLVRLCSTKSTSPQDFRFMRFAESLDDFRYVGINFFAVALSGGS